MANIKVSEMTEATLFDDSDYAMIVQSNQNKKISKENMLQSVADEIDGISNTIGDLNNLNIEEKSSVVGAINSIAGDYVVESSSTNNTGYIKYNSGIMIQWGEAIVTEAVQTAHGALYRTANAQTVTFQEKFGANFPVVYLTAQANLNFAYLADFINSGLDGFRFYPLTVGSSAAATRYVKWLAIGRWKETEQNGGE